jgi:hypothetical protein
MRPIEDDEVKVICQCVYINCQNKIGFDLLLLVVIEQEISKPSVQPAWYGLADG